MNKNPRPDEEESVWKVIRIVLLVLTIDCGLSVPQKRPRMRASESKPS